MKEHKPVAQQVTDTETGENKIGKSNISKAESTEHSKQLETGCKKGSW